MENFNPYFLNAQFIIKRWRLELNEEEEKQFQAWLAQDDGNRILFENLSNTADLKTAINDYSGIDKEKAWERIAKETGFQKSVQKKHPLLNFYKYAAILFLLLASSVFVYNKLKKEPAGSLNDVKPGGNNAELTLADGSKIILNNARNGQLARQGTALIQKTNSGQLVYKITGTSNTVASYNTITTPKGGAYQVILADGSKIWLNALSSIRFPTAFNTAERRVEIKGEAYFEIAKDKIHPFIVTTEGQQVAVLGTHFNINAYKDEVGIKTTLLEGSVRISLLASNAKALNPLVLEPGQQSVYTNNNITISDANTDEAVAWKNGYFQFNKASLPFLMRQLSRWYDIDIVYQGEMTEHEFIGEIKRNNNLSQVLKILEQGGIHFKIEGRRLIVMP